VTEATAPPRRAHPLRHWLLAIIVTVLTILPLLVFATDLPNRAPVRAAREAALARAGVKPLDPAVREERSRKNRASRHPTLGNAVLAMLVQLFWVCIVAWVGRRGFGLRL
jgi:hypothetical protein